VILVFFFRSGCIACSDGLKYALVGLYTRRIGQNDPAEVIVIRDLYENPGFNYETAVFDQMVIKLDRPASEDRPLLRLNLDADIPSQDGQELNIIGLGYIDNDENLPTVLQQVAVDFFPNDQCQDSRAYQSFITNDMICVHATSNGVGQCNGDSGGAYLLLGDSPETDLHVGTVSW
jgi:secreted trypsin-like serine protease